MVMLKEPLDQVEEAVLQAPPARGQQAEAVGQEPLVDPEHLLVQEQEELMAHLRQARMETEI